ncbi:hypothetical protein M426DRAFT_323208 [Hypoxylon sp. CI-4A]|nr:hypothetical protein M426DRAFT_323208 [Hypoxylon sp. CI-4A]
MSNEIQYLALIVAAFIFLYYALIPSRRLPLPPGPSPLPIIGNLHQAPKSESWLKYYDWAREYGPIMHFSLLGQSVIVISSLRIAQDLLAKRGSIYSDRPRLVVAGELATNGLHILLRPYNARLRLHQRMEAPILNSKASDSYSPVQDLESKQLLYDLLSNGNNKRGTYFHEIFQRTTASTIYSLAYGYRLKTGKEEELVNAQKVQIEFGEMVQVGRYLVDTFPILNHLPKFLAPWKREAEKSYRKHSKLHVGNAQRALEGTVWNFSKRMAESAAYKTSDMGIEEFAFDIGEIANAALDTTTMTMDWFIAAWVTQDGNESFVARAQGHIDRVVGKGRLPTYEDRPNLPYIDAIVEELLRWRPIAPAGIPHMTKYEDTYEGYRIPAGSIVIPHHWAICREKDIFGEDVDDFRPERWLTNEVDERSSPRLKDLPTVGFGFGRRMCPGRHIARNSLWLQITRLLWAFDIEIGSLDSGERIRIDPMKCTDSVIVMPQPFKAVFRPRGPWVKELIMKDCDTRGVDHVDFGIMK